ncbi:uncharacterized protein TNCT_644361 [Trichonephila clavata]|uniref:Uncharacterized protein n=1 Tax=Trichonephila clavata TaxID=2740835 RepID=A0A8X6G1J4_TRICU|nr:uncharacterized protein TNCT_644361 [Trichonephila clavata]
MEIMKAATFELRCWAHTGVQDQESQNILGLKWDTETDELYCKIGDLSLEISIQQICLPGHVIGLNFSGLNGGRVQSGSTKVQNVGYTLRLLFHKKRRKSVAVNLTIDTNDNFGNRFLYFSSYPKIIRMTAWVLRFCHNLKANSHKLRKELKFQEIQMAEEPVIRIIQAEWLSEMQEKYSKTIQFYEENKILKVRSRLILGEDAEDFVRTTVLPDHPIV